MKIEAYIDGRSYSENGSGFAVILLSPNNKWMRSFSFGKNSVNRTDLLACKFVILSIADKTSEIIINTKNDYIINMFKKHENGSWFNNPSNNNDLINEIRNLMSNLKIVFNKSSGELAEICKKLAVDAIKNNKLCDLRR